MSIIRDLLTCYICLVIIDTILTFIPKFENEVWRKKIREWANYTLNPIRQKIEILRLPIDISPLILILLIQLFRILW